VNKKAKVHQKIDCSAKKHTSNAGFEKCCGVDKVLQLTEMSNTGWEFHM